MLQNAYVGEVNMEESRKTKSKLENWKKMQKYEVQRKQLHAGTANSNNRV